LAWGCIARWGVVGAGIAFFLSYVFHAGLLYVLVSKMTGFRWSGQNARVATLCLGITALVFAAVYLLSNWTAAAFGTATAGLLGVYSARILFKIVPENELPRSVRRVADVVRLARSASHT
jgi:enterobacterial common antigen flippase